MVTRSHIEIDLSEEARLAQLRRIAELQGRIEAREVISSWFTKKPMDESSYETQGYGQETFPMLSRGFGSFGASNTSLTPEPSHAMDQVFKTEQMQYLENAYGPSHSNMNGWLNNKNLQNDVEIPDVQVQQQIQSYAGDTLADMSVETPQSYRMSSTPSKASGSSSNTSADVADIKIETDEAAVLHGGNENSSPTSSLSSQLSPAKSSTPATSQPPIYSGKAKRRRRSVEVKKPSFSDLRPRTSYPTNIPHEEVARQSVEAALSSRLNPFALHPGEHQLLRDHICHLHVSAYLNVRNRILRLWVRNPLVSVTAEEAAGCAYSSKWLGLAEVAYEWLLRRGYINFGCVEVPDISNTRVKKHKLKRRKTIVVVGAGMAGLGCARQLEGLFSHYRERWNSTGEESPQVILLEGRARIGGRIYSHPLKNQNTSGIPKQSRSVAEMGAHIITGFDHGNPLNMIIRGQLALHYYPLKDNSSLYDVDGRVVNWKRDKMVEKLFNDILERASAYRHKTTASVTAEGDRELIESGRDPTGDAGNYISSLEGEYDMEVDKPQGNEIQQVTAGLDKLTGKAHTVAGSRKEVTTSVAAAGMGWKIMPNKVSYQELDLENVIKSSKYPTLGAALDEGVKHYQQLLNLTPQDLRLLNWHFANLEYANAAPVDKLSLGGWDQDIGNEFEGEHAQVIGGYQQVPQGILHYPTKLNLRTRKAVTKVEYNSSLGVDAPTMVHCEDGDTVEADHIVLTTPLGVLKHRSIGFVPELPSWKQHSIDHLGYGILNKVILVYEKPFWDVDQDMVGLLRAGITEKSSNQDDYKWNRGRFYLFWNCIKTSGRPVLIGLMAGEAAHHAEMLSDEFIVAEVTEKLATMFREKSVPRPSESIVTRWGKDRFARGTYSYVGPKAHSRDYDIMAMPIGSLHFAGEATCGTHPATVHGAYISGLRAAAEVVDDLLGPIAIPTPLVPTSSIKVESMVSTTPDQVPGPSTTVESAAIKQARLEAFETEILKQIFSKLGPRPDKPGKASANPFLLYSKDKWIECKAKCDEARRMALGNPAAKASRNEVRTALGLMWREASNETKQPYIDQTVSNRAVNHESAATFQDRLLEWDAEAMSIRREYVRSHPDVLSKVEEKEMWQALGVYGGVDRKAKRMSGYADDSGSDGNA